MPSAPCPCGVVDDGIFRLLSSDPTRLSDCYAALVNRTVGYDPFIRSQLASRKQLESLLWCKLGRVTPQRLVPSAPCPCTFVDDGKFRRLSSDPRGRWILGYLEKGIQTSIAQGQSTNVISMIQWTTTGCSDCYHLVGPGRCCIRESSNQSPERRNCRPRRIHAPRMSVMLRVQV